MMVGKGTRGAGSEAPKNVFQPSLLHVRNTPFLKRERALQKRRFHSYVEKGRSLDLQGPLAGLYKPTAFQM